MYSKIISLKSEIKNQIAHISPNFITSIKKLDQFMQVLKRMDELKKVSENPFAIIFYPTFDIYIISTDSKLGHKKIHQLTSNLFPKNEICFGFSILPFSSGDFYANKPYLFKLNHYLLLNPISNFNMTTRQSGAITPLEITNQLLELFNRENK